MSLEALAEVARLATQPRGKGTDDRDSLRFPTLRSYYAKARFDSDGQLIRKAPSYWRDIWAYLQEWGFKIGNDLQAQGLSLPDHETLSELYRARVLERAVIWHPMDHDGRSPGLTPDEVEGLSEEAATATLRDWGPGYIEERRRLGRLGGVKSKRVAIWKVDGTLDVLELLTGMPPMLQLEALNEGRDKPFSRSTFYEIKAELHKRQRPEPDEFRERQNSMVEAPLKVEKINLEHAALSATGERRDTQRRQRERLELDPVAALETQRQWARKVAQRSAARIAHEESLERVRLYNFAHPPARFSEELDDLLEA